jgi:RNA polymerase sigma-70 factor, ECF subfamily
MSSDAPVHFAEASTSMLEGLDSCRCEPPTLSSSISDLHPRMLQDPCFADFTTKIPEVSDELLLEQIRQGTKEALSLIFRRHARAVRNVAYRILQNEAEADDLVQDVFLFIFSKAALFDAALGTARSWIIHLTYHRAFDRRRYLITRHFYTRENLDNAAAGVADGRGEIKFHEQSIEGIWGKQSGANLRALLSAEQLKTLEMYFFEGYTLEEIAKETGQTRVNVRNHYYRALQKLRKPAFAGKLRSK